MLYDEIASAELLQHREDMCSYVVDLSLRDELSETWQSHYRSALLLKILQSVYNRNDQVSFGNVAHYIKNYVDQNIDQNTFDPLLSGKTNFID
jgi:hypothetical protein